MTEPIPIQSEKNTTEEEQSWLFKIVILPKYFGEAILNLLGKSDATEASKFILGYILIVALVLLVLGIIAPEIVKALLNYFFQ